MKKRGIALLLLLSMFAVGFAKADAPLTPIPVVTLAGEPIPTPAPLVTPAPTPREIPSAMLPAQGKHTIRWPKGMALPYAKDQPVLRVYLIQMAAFDCFLITCEGEAALVDCGSTRNVFSILEEAGVEHFKFLFNTHPHGDHMNGYPELLSRVTTDKLYTMFDLDYDEAQRKLCRWMKKLGVPVEQLPLGAKLNVGGAELTFYDLKKRKIVNNRSALVHIRYGDRTMLLTADIGAIAQIELAAIYGQTLKSDVMKVPHHGLELMSPDFVSAVDPEEVFISYRHIDGITSMTYDQLKRFGLDPLFVGDGSLIYSTDGGEYWLIEQKPYIPPQIVTNK